MLPLKHPNLRRSDQRGGSVVRLASIVVPLFGKADEAGRGIVLVVDFQWDPPFEISVTESSVNRRKR